MIEIKDLLEQVDNDIVIEIMEENGSPLFSTSIDNRSGQTCLWFKTICHGGDSHKLCYFSESKDFYCYTNCGRMTFFTFIQKILGLKKKDFYKALTYVASKVGYTVQTNRYGIGDNEDIKINKAFIAEENRRLASRERLLQPITIPNIEKFYNPGVLQYFDDKTFYGGWIDEGISVQSMQKFGIRYFWDEGHIIIPHYNIDGKLVGIRRRSLDPADAHNKYMPAYVYGNSYEHALGLNLYGLHENKEMIKLTRSATLVEGEKSVLLADTYYEGNSTVVATCGFNVSNWQIEALKQLGVTTVYLGFDKDYDVTQKNIYKTDSQIYNGFIHYYDKINNLATRLQEYFNTRVIIDRQKLLQIKDSPLDRGKSTFEQLKTDSQSFYLGASIY